MSWVEPQFHTKWVSCVFIFYLISMFVDVTPCAASGQENGREKVVQPQHSVEFSAGLTWHREGKTSRAQLFVKGDRYRIEYLGGIKTDLGFAGVTIVRLDQQKVWYVYSQRRLVLSVPVTKKDVLPFSVTLNGEVSRTFIGDAFVGKYPANLYEIEVLTQLGRHEKYFEWVDAERPVLLKLLSQNRDWWVEYEHVVVSKQPDYFFEPPLGYRKVEAQETVPGKGRS